MYDVTDAHMHIGWFNDDTGEWDKPEPSLPAFMTQPDTQQKQAGE